MQICTRKPAYYDAIQWKGPFDHSLTELQNWGCRVTPAPVFIEPNWLLIIRNDAGSPVLTCQKGDWILKDAGGRFLVYTDQAFKRQFDVIPPVSVCTSQGEEVHAIQS